MIRAVVIACLVLSLACTPKRAAVVGGVTFAGAVGMGVPLGRDCELEASGECKHAYAFYMTIGAVVGLAIGLVAAAQLEPERHTEERPLVDGATATLRFDAEPARAAWSASAEVTAQGLGFVSTCIAAKRLVVDRLENQCGSRLQRVSVLGEACDCAHDGILDLDRCTTSGSATCSASDPHRLGFAVASEAVARDQAEVDATARCAAVGGSRGALTSACSCDGDTCGCVADVACSPAGAVP